MLTPARTVKATLAGTTGLVRVAVVATLFAVAGCGLTYQSPQVIVGQEDGPVDVVPMTAVEVARANRTPYTPRGLPGAFYQTAGMGSGLRGAGALPEQPFLPDERREALQLRPLPDVSDAPYRIGVGDVVLLATRGSGSTVEQLSGLLAAQSQRQGYTVRDDGAIAIPEIGAVQIAGLTLQEAEDRVFDTLVANQIDPAFSLEIAEFNSQRVTVGGAVGTTRLVPLGLNPVTLRDAITAAGGLTVRDAEFASIRVYRDGTLYQIPVDAYQDDASLGNALLVDRDAVFVDTSYDLDRALEFYRAELDVITRREEARNSALDNLQAEISIRRSALQEQRGLFEARVALDAVDRDYVYLAGEVNNQARFALPYESRATLADVLYGEGGFDVTTGDPSQIYVLRDGTFEGRSGRVIAYHLDASNVVRMMQATQFEMRPRDNVFIEEQPITKWSRALQQLFPVIANTAARSATTGR